MIIGDHMVDDDYPGIGLFERFDLGDRRLPLARGRHERGPVEYSPAVILGMCDFDPACAERDGEPDHISSTENIGAVNDGVHGERQARLRNPFRDRLFTREGALVARDPVGRWRVGILN